MQSLKRYFLSPEPATEIAAEELDAAIDRYEWFTLARMLRARQGGPEDPRLKIVAAGRSLVVSPQEKIDAAALTRLTTDDVIDRFLRETDLRIVAREEGPEPEIPTEAVLDEEDDVVSEELAEVYLAQGLRDQALVIYRRLSLLNPEKSVYFAEIIRRMETNN